MTKPRSLYENNPDPLTDYTTNEIMPRSQSRGRQAAGGLAVEAKRSASKSPAARKADASLAVETPKDRARSTSKARGRSTSKAPTSRKPAAEEEEAAQPIPIVGGKTKKAGAAANGKKGAAAAAGAYHR